MDCIKQTIYIALILFSSSLISCVNGSGKHKNRGEESRGALVYENPIDSIIHNTLASDCFTAVYDYLIENPDFLTASEKIGYHNLIYGESSKVMIWKELGGIRVYSIPEDSHYTTYCHNIIQIKCGDKIRIDTTFLSENGGWIEDLFEIKGQDSKNYYILKTCIYIAHQGEIYNEYLNAFSLEEGHLVKEKIFHANGMQYDKIEVSCGGMRYCPLQWDDVILIGTFNLDDRKVPTIIVAETNERDWPTGYGMEYEWTGRWFEQTRRRYYDVDGYTRTEEAL